jgi:hypothetical protein
MTIHPTQLRKAARIIALVYAIPALFIIPFILAFGNRPWPPLDYLYASLMGLYIIGLFLGLKLQGLGGLISIIYPVSQIILILFELIKGNTFDGIVVTSIGFIIILIPSMLYLISWNSQRKQG